MSQDTLDLLSKVSFLKEADRGMLNMVADLCQRKAYRAGKVLFKEGAEASGLGIVVEGQISIDRHLGNGKTIHIALRGPGEVIGEMSLLDGLPRSATATAARASTVLTLRHEDFVFCLRRSFDLQMLVMRSLSIRLRESSDYLASLNLKNVEQRLATQLLKLIDHSDSIPTILLDMPQHELAQRCWCTREHVNRALARLRKTGVLRRIQGRNFQVDLDALESRSRA